MRRLLLSFVAVALCAGTMPAFRAEEASWMVGLARTKITPSKPVYLSGYASRNHPFEQVVTDLFLKVLVLQDETGHATVLVTTDLIGFRGGIAERIREGICKTTGLLPNEVLLTSSHTHTGPSVSLDPTPTEREMTEQQGQDRVEYTEWLVDQAIQTVVRASAQLQPARLSHGTGVATFVMNRREFTPKGVILGVNPRGLADRSVPVLRVDSPDGKPLAVVFGAACHNTTLTGKHYIVCGDFAGFAQTLIENKYPGVQAMFVQGCGGSANPFPRGTLEASQAHGTQLGTEVCRVLETRLEPVTGPLRTELVYVTLPLQPAPSREELDRLSTGRSGWQPWVAQQMRAVLDKGEELPTSHRLPVACWQFGTSFTLIGLPGEVVVDYVPLIEKAIGPLNLWIAAYCNDVFGYLPSKQVLAEGGYETRGLYSGGIGFFAPEAQDILVDHVRALADRLGRPDMP